MFPGIIPLVLSVSFINYLYTLNQHNKLKEEIKKIKTDYKIEIRAAIVAEINRLYNDDNISLNNSSLNDNHLW